MAYEDINRGHIELLINNENWKAARRALMAYMDERGPDYWSKNMLAKVDDHLQDREENS